MVLRIGSPMVIGGAEYRWRAKLGMCFAEHCGASYIQRTPRVMYVLLTIVFNALIMMVRGTCIWLALDPQMGLGVLLVHCRQEESDGPNNQELVLLPIKGHPVDKNGWYFSKRVFPSWKDCCHTQSKKFLFTNSPQLFGVSHSWLLDARGPQP